jgi:RimJ/RimL family protein N-acetyltransferase
VADAEAASDEHYLEVVRRLEREWGAGTRLSWAIREHAGGGAIGAVELRPRGDKTEVSYLVEPEFRGRGLATKALAAVLAWAKDELTLHGAVLTCHVDNVASQRVAERCGFTRASREGDELRYLREL